MPDDSWFGLEPGRPRRVVLRALGDGAVEPPVRIAALNAFGSGVVEAVRPG
jgi:hypothetical protein